MEDEVIYVDANKKPIPIGTITTTKVYDEIVKGVEMGKTLISEQGGTRSGKTVTTMIWVVLQMLNKKIKVGITRKTLPTAKATILKDFEDVMRQMGIYDATHFNKTDMTYTFDNGSTVIFFASDQAEKLKGRKNTITWLNEATEFSYSDYQQLRFRTEELMLLDYNPNYSESHWINRVNEDERTYHFITTYKDNPYLPQAIVDEIESMKKSNYQWWVQFGTGQRCLSNGRIFQDIKIVDDYVWPKETYMGLDFGYGAKPTALVRMAIVKDTLYCQELMYNTDAEPDFIARTINKWKDYQVVADSANPLEITLVKKSLKDPKRLVAVNKHGRSGAKARLAAVHAMSKMHIVIVATVGYPCYNMSKEFGEYCYKEDGNGNITNEPIGENDHTIDACRYVYMEKAPKKKRKGITIN